MRNYFVKIKWDINKYVKVFDFYKIFNYYFVIRVYYLNRVDVLGMFRENKFFKVKEKLVDLNILLEEIFCGDFNF